jgi:hypothetical protein
MQETNYIIEVLKLLGTARLIILLLLTQQRAFANIAGLVQVLDVQ